MAAKKRIGIDFKKAQRMLNPVGPRLLPLKDASQWLGLSLWAMRERVWAGDIPVVRFDGGRKMYIDTLDLERFIQTHKETIE